MERGFVYAKGVHRKRCFAPGLCCEEIQGSVLQLVEKQPRSTMLCTLHRVSVVYSLHTWSSKKGARRKVCKRRPNPTSKCAGTRKRERTNSELSNIAHSSVSSKPFFVTIVIRRCHGLGSCFDKCRLTIEHRPRFGNAAASFWCGNVVRAYSKSRLAARK